MAKRGRKPRLPGESNNPSTPGGDNGAAGRRGDGESIMGYFRRILLDNRKLLNTRSNDELLKRWLDDHPGEKTVPNRVKQGLSNIKSQLRKNQRQRKARKAAVEAEALEQGTPLAALTIVQVSQPLEHVLEPLEIQIDDCMTLAKNLDRQGLENVIHLLRRARNEVVWKIGQ
jgi:hypothetical protein